MIKNLQNLINITNSKYTQDPKYLYILEEPHFQKAIFQLFKLANFLKEYLLNLKRWPV
ncbi:unnamed protein product [Paramecium octaurelia]|uniref:Uncharacterized protein n=1 Tax=Paramecium octaurelia TaxID=43137 RepID=A0A8S1SBK1_PAROT|nr:unnamed protein product [Paramecium octaurelia]